ncbi:MBL fold metallo-hydrolase [Hymenobacter pini]|uniref:hypothetical protein n=1 Tax=Hymenobacter pini TaxID=2880879 RepID=UPI001CF0EC02|nr:hypothetical protein [Hymenobacter pini]MCA8833379.1 hypothetical protein [Hymenobacter pini]
MRRLAPLFFLLLTLTPKTPAQAAPPHPLVRVQPVAPRVFVPTSRPQLAGPASNGLLIQTPKGLLLVDAAWSAAQTEQLLRWATDSLHQPVRLLVLTHAGAATPEALEVLRRHHVRLYSSPLTARRWHSSHPQAPALVPALKPYTLIRAGRTRLELFFPGAKGGTEPGVAWLPKQKILFSGKVAPASGQQPSSRAERASLRTVAARYHRARVVVPAHGAVGTLALLGR